MRPLAAVLTALLATATLTLGAVAPAQAADYVPPATVNLVKGQNVGELMLVPDGAYEGGIGWRGDQWLPPGLSRDTSTPGMELVGTPTTAGIYPFWIELQYVRGGPWIKHPVEFRVADTPVWSTTTLPNGRVNTPYGMQLVVTPFADSFAVTAGSLPSGMTLTNTGYLVGTPTAHGSSMFQVTATNPLGSVSQWLTLSVPPPPTWVTTSLPPATVGVAYDQQLVATDAAAFGLPNGSAMPPGLTLSNSGRITGTPTWPTTFTFTVNAASLGGTTQQAFTLTVAPATPPAPAWQTTALPALEVGVPVTTQLAATDTTTYAVTAGALPAGLTLAGSTISGTPTTPWGYSFTITATGPGGSTQQAFSGSVTPGLVAWQTESIGPFLLGESVDLQLSATYATHYQVHLGTLPPGLTLTDGGRLHGTAQQVGTWTPTLAAGNSRGGQIKTFPITVTWPTPVWQTATLPAMQVGEPFSVTLEASHTTTFTWVGGTIPDGLQLVGHQLIGTPTTPGPYSFTIAASGPGGVQPREFTGTVAAGDVEWATDSVGPFSVDAAVSVQLEATNTTKYEIALGRLPAGLSLTDGGLLQGTPTEWGPFTVTVRALNADGNGRTRVFTFDVVERAEWVGETEVLLQTGSTIRLTPSSVEGGEITGASADPGAPFTVELTPDGEVDLTGDRAGIGTASIEYSNGIGTWTQSVEVEVRDAPAWITESLGTLRAGVATEIELEAEHAAGFAVTAGGLPAGLELSADGTIAGTPEVTGPYVVHITAHSTVEGFTGATRRFEGVVASPLVSWVTEALGPFSVASEVSVQLEATDATGFEVVGDSLPAGLTLTADGLLRGTPTEAGTGTATIRALNADGDGEARAFDVEVIERATWALGTSFVLQAGSTHELGSAVANGSVTEASVAAGSPVTAEVTASGDVVIEALRAGTGVVTVTYTNGIGTWTQELQVEVRDAPAWLTESLGELRQGVAAEISLEADHAAGFEVTAGALPAGLSLDADGTISGTPEAFGPYDVTIAATSTVPGAAGVTRQFTGAVAAPLVVWVTDGMPLVQVGEDVRIELEATNAIEFEVTDGELPDGLDLVDGVIVGSPAVADVFEFEVTARNADGDGAAMAFELDVRAPAAWAGPTSLLATTGDEIEVPASSVEGGTMLSAVPGAGALFSAELNAEGGVTVTALRAGTGTLTVGFTNHVGVWTQDVEIEVRDAPVWVTDTFFDLREGDPVDVALEASNAVGFAIVGGALPAGVELTEDGRIEGSPTELGRFEVTIAATNGDVEADRTFFGFVAAPLVEWVTESFGVLDRNVEVELPLEATHAVEFALTDGELPPGLVLTETPSIAGTPTETGTFEFELTAYNATGESFAHEFELVVEQAELSLVLRADPGDEASGIEIEADASGLAPSSAWSVVLHSEPVAVAAGDASDEGLVDASASLPTPVPFGAHELRFSAVGGDGVAVQTSVWFSVGETGLVEEISTTGPVAEPTRTPPSVPGSGEPAAGDAGRIASTGVEPAGWLAVAAALLVAGAAAVAAFGRRFGRWERGR